MTTAPPPPPAAVAQDETSQAEQLMAEGEIAQASAFDPRPYLVNLNSRGAYLEVKWRLVWLRRVHPDALIETELVRGGPDSQYAVFKATVTIPGGGGATGWKQETETDFRDFLEKAETGAIGRALAALGFGTQFVQDHEYGVQSPQTGTMRIVDNPVTFATQRGRERAQDTGSRYSKGALDAVAAPGARGMTATAQESQRATERQVKFIYAIARESGLDEQELAAWAQELYGKDVDQLNRRDASTLIEALQRRRNEVQ